MMNIRDYFFINKTKNTNKIKILDLLGFEADISIDTSEYESVNIEESENLDQQSFDDLISNTEEITTVPTKSSIESYLNPSDDISQITLDPSTDTFNPLKITSQIQKVWSDLESRRKWVIPAFISITIIIITSFSINSFFNYQNVQTEIAEDAIVVTSNSNELIDLLPTLIEISTNTFYSKYDVSNASANLQQIESSLLEYKLNLDSRNDIPSKEDVLSNLNDIFILVDELDLVITYRILISEILIYSELPVKEEDVNIDLLTAELSSIIAQSKVNYSSLPEILEFTNHKNLVDIALITAEDLHGRYLAALRNNEYDVAQSISSAIILNKSTEIKAFENSLDVFNQKSLDIYRNLSDLP